MNLYKLHSKPWTLDLHDQAHEIVPELVWEKYKNKPVELKKREKSLAKSAQYAYYYALDILGKRFPAGEASIATKPSYAYRYAKYVLRWPFPAGEPAVAKDLYWAYQYASDILNKPCSFLKYDVSYLGD